jgi:hypothetical protein
MRSKIVGILVAVALMLGMGGGAQADEFLFGNSFSGGTQDLVVTTMSGMTFTLSTDMSQFDAGIDNQGWWSATFGNSDTNDNYFTGFLSPADTLRDFFTFDISGLTPTDPVTSATLMLTKYTAASDTGAAAHSLTFFDVSTDPATLNMNDGVSAAIFTDLGSGASYGSFSVLVDNINDTVTVLSFLLNAAAVADINAALAGGATFFSVGGAGPAPAAISEPATVRLLGIGLVALLGVRLWSRRRASV